MKQALGRLESIKIFFGVTGVLIGVIFIVFVVDLNSLPRDAEVSRKHSSRDVFGSGAWKVDLNTTGNSNFTPFFCAVCFPSAVGSNECAQTISLWIARGILGEQESRQIWRSLELFKKQKSVEIKYSEELQEMLFISFSAHLFSRESFSDVCIEKFAKPCDKLEKNELILLGLSIRNGNNSSNTDILNKVESACSK